MGPLTQVFNLTPVENGMEGSKVGTPETLLWDTEAANLIK